MDSRIKPQILLLVCLHLGPAGLFPSVQNNIPEGGVSLRQVLENIEAKKFSGRRIDFVVSHRGLQEAFADLEKAAGLRLELDPSIDDRVTYRMLEVPWDEALAAILSDHSLFIAPNPAGEGFKVGRGELVVLGLNNPDRARLILFLYDNLEWIIGGIFFFLVAVGISLYVRRRHLTQRRTAPREALLSPEDAARTKKKLFHLLDVERIYRDDDTTLPVFAEKLGVSAHQLSWLLNEEIRRSFSSLINEYRVEEVKRRLSDPSLNHTTILRIGLEAGFNTKASFNRAFKRITKMTPSQFKKSASGQPSLPSRGEPERPHRRDDR